jgi:hypothetical protein
MFVFFCIADGNDRAAIVERVVHEVFGHTASLCVGSGRNSILLIYTIISIVCQAK